MSDFKYKDIGRCLTEATHKDFDKLVTKCERFVVYSQFDTHLRIGRYLKKPECGVAEVLYGIDANGNQIKLKSIIDTSD